MSKQEEKGMVPERRFHEFRDAGEWCIKHLGDVAELITEKAGDKNYTLMSITAGVGLVTQIEKFGKEIAGDSYKNYYVINKGDFAYNKSSTKQHPEGQMTLLENIDQGAVPNSIFTCFRVDKESVSPYFLKYPFANNIHGKWLRNFIALGARANGALNVNTKDLLTLPITFPSLKEQQKIADCLTSVDELLTAQTQKLDALKAHKKGLMQQLFPADGESVPKHRFPEFRDNGEWEQKPLSTLVKSLDAGVSVNSGDRPANKNERGILKTSAVTSGFFDSSENKIVTDAKESSRLKEPVLKNTIIISRMNTPALVGANAYIEASYDNLFLPDRLWAAKPKPGTSMRFIAYILGGGQGRAALSALATGTSGSMKNISKSAVLEINISTPSAEEQQKIADCLTSIDELITAQSQKIDTLKAHKKGLMQQLFPAMDEVSA